MRNTGFAAALSIVALAGPVLLAFNLPPSPTLLNQCLSIGLTGGWIAWLSAGTGMAAGPVRDFAALLAALGLLVVGLAASLAAGLPVTIAVDMLCVIGACAATILAAGVAARCGAAQGAGRHLLQALVWAGVVSAVIGCVQVFAPDWPDGDWIARSGLPGRAVGNLRQPNHLSSLLLWSLIAVVGLLELRRLRRPLALAIALLLVFAVVLSGSRTGALGMLVLAAWGLLDRRLSRPARLALMASPLIFAAMWWGMTAWAHESAHAFGGEGRLSLDSGGDISSSRFAIWSNALTMLAREPLTGVGFGEFNIAWTLTELPHRPTAFFDHTHNLPLQLFVELGLPLGLLVTGLLLAALLQARRRAWSHAGNEGSVHRAAFMIVLMIGLHSLLEYPLWYAYFLLPTAFAWGYALSRPAAAADSHDATSAAAAPPRGSRALAATGLAMSLGAAAAVLDYRQVGIIYDPPEVAAPLEERIARGQRSPLFGHHADYAAATAFGEPKAPLSPSQQLAFRRAPHQLLDVRLMIAWSQALAAQGELDKARWLAARIREFRNSGADEFFEPCQRPEQAAHSFQCQPPQRVVNWREFVQR
jgi:O-antigen ligase